MTDEQQRPQNRRPQNQTSENEGPIQQAQRNERSTRGRDTSRGSEPATGQASRDRG